MKYSIRNVEIKADIDFGRLEMDISNVEEEWLEEHETMMPYQASGSEIRLSAMNMANGDVRSLTSFDLNDYADITAIED